MSREIRRVPVGWKHPVQHNPHWEFQARPFMGRHRPPSRLHGTTEQFVPLMGREMLDYCDEEYPEEKPDDSEFMPVFDGPECDLGWCLYQTVSEGTPTTPIFATADGLIEHLCTVGEDYDQEPYRRKAAEALVRSGHSFGSMAVIGGHVYDGAKDLDLLARDIQEPT